MESDFTQEKKINSIDEIEINLKQWQLFNTDSKKKDEHKINFLDSGEEQDDNIVCINEDIEVTILAENVFAQLLKKDNIKADDINHSLSPDLNRD